MEAAVNQNEDERLAAAELARRLRKLSPSSISGRDFWKLKIEISREFKLKRVLKNSDVFPFLDDSSKDLFDDLIRRKSIRTRSGIAVVTAITKPFDCPHGTCTFCPGGVRFGTPQSYTTDSPAASFGLSRKFDPLAQVTDSLELLRKNGHDTSKIELILLGGTILSMPQDYQNEFVKLSYDALNGQSSECLEDAIMANENAMHRCVGLTIETKPDWCKEEHIDLLLSYAATRVEIGVQSLDDKILKAINRGHTVRDTYEALGVAKDSAFKIVAHMMPGLPGSYPEKDLQDLISLVDDPRLKPDMLKIYPTLVVEGTALYNQYKMGKYTPYELEALVDILSRFKRNAPPWLRIMRIQREMPRYEISGGVRAGNLRQIVLEDMKQKGYKCRCIRCRELGHHPGERADFNRMEMERIYYDSSDGQEIFLSFEDRLTDSLFGFLRLRIPSGEEHRPEIRGKRAGLVRELHVYGSVVPVGKKSSQENQSQHRGQGTRLLEEAERIAKEEFKRKKLIVISASGTREYYRKRGYRDDGVYVSKVLGN